ncbi:aldehyde dehydrogenase family protein [Gryllotalpicola protaetiae]|uniref:Aldehyde dehydrogenase family protein n=1 Tax=Gryllotalpicola protaetiae TaxID=2419771 RepID=A0A387BKH0_9MICO|nr:aldehyde dehydrogenase family protein [Gryllotalpicola protaetiae]AYG04373.1 aldehyde dehydrogenase family protein [Gryllotalpicola protaetiae]
MAALVFPDFARHGDAEEELTISDPRTGDVVGTVRCTGDGELRQTVDTSRIAQALWEQAPAESRGRLLREASDLIAAHAGELARLTARETGQSEADARSCALAGVDALRRFAELGAVHGGRSLAGVSTASDYTRFEPRGVAVVLTPWNDPVAVACGLIGAAVVTGNTVIHKPSERAPHTGLRLGRLLSDVLPPDVVQTVVGGPGVGSRLVGDPLIDVVVHVGSSASGQAVSRLAAVTGAHVVRANGGNDALIVDAGLDPRWCAREAAQGAFASSGQLGTAVERIYVHRDIAEPFIAELAAAAAQLNETGELAPLVDERMCAHVDEQVQDAVANGARAIVGGAPSPGPGCGYPATVLVGCTPTMAVMREETFGPVAPVQVVDDFDEALIAAGNDRYGLSATVLTSQIAHAELAIAELQVGSVKINNVFGGAPGASSQPRRDSGLGFGYGPELLNELSVAKLVHLAAPGGRASA